MNRTIIIFAMAVFVLLGVGAYMLLGNASPQTKEEAIRQAEQFESKRNCTQAEVPAIHSATGAEYTFPTGCIAPGWEAKR